MAPESMDAGRYKPRMRRWVYGWVVVWLVGWLVGLAGSRADLGARVGALLCFCRSVLLCFSASLLLHVCISVRALVCLCACMVRMVCLCLCAYVCGLPLRGLVRGSMQEVHAWARACLARFIQKASRIAQSSVVDFHPGFGLYLLVCGCL